MPNLVKDALLPVLPVERPMRAVAVHLPRRVPVAQNVVAHHLIETVFKIDGMDGA